MARRRKTKGKAETRLLDRFKWLLQVSLDHRLRRSTVSVAAAILAHRDNESGLTRISHDTLAEIAHCHPVTTFDAVDQLIEHGFLDVSEIGGRSATGTRWANVYCCRLEVLDESEKWSARHGSAELARVKAEREKRQGGHALHEKVRAELATHRKAQRRIDEKA